MTKSLPHLLATAALLAATQAFAATTVATYQFDNTFAADQAGLPALTPVDPTGTSVFQTDTVLGQSRTVWAFNGNNDPTTGQSGLTLNTTGLLTSPASYSVDMVFQFNQRPNAWRRIADVQNRASDAGFYVDPSNNLDIFPVSGSTATWTNDIYHHVVFTDDGTTVETYLDGVSQFSTTTSELNLNFDPTDNPNQLLGFFLDNTVGTGIGEWSSGSVALIRLWDGVLTSDEAQALANNPFVTPEPASLTLLALASPLLLRRRRKI